MLLETATAVGKIRVWGPTVPVVLVGNSILDARALRIEYVVALRAFGGGALFGDVAGEGPPRVLALHGWGRRGTDFAASLQGIPYIALDLPGFGATPAFDEPRGAGGYAVAVLPVLEEMAARPILVGHSFGGRVAVVLASRYPERIGGLVLTGVPLLRRSHASGPRLRYRLWRWGHRAGVVSDLRMERIRRRYGSADYRAATGVMRQTLVTVVHESYENELRTIKAPVCLVWGADDTEVPLQIAHKAKDLLAESGVEVWLDVLEGVGHWVPTEAPAALREAVEQMLQHS
ncbi:MAG TPA: alpha/beta hydrolase [Acidimicrobiia bacterium]|nr:alpha/beta hydrolase [Acidimicrobiia bacterium]